MKLNTTLPNFSVQQMVFSQKMNHINLVDIKIYIKPIVDNNIQHSYLRAAGYVFFHQCLDSTSYTPRQVV